MGKASRWFQGFLGIKKQHDSSTTSQSQAKPPKRRWSFVKSNRKNDHNHQNGNSTLAKTALGSPDVSPAPTQPDDSWKHAVAVAAATAAVAEAAVATAHAAAAVVRLTSRGRSMEFLSGGDVNTASCVCGSGSLVVREESSAVKIQSHFRAYLARRAFRALKALVKLQALVRGHIVRKQTTEALQSLQALLKAQARARAGRAQVSDTPRSTMKSSQFHHPDPVTPEIFENSIRTKGKKCEWLWILKRNGSKTNGRAVSHQEKEQMGWKWLDRGTDAGLGEQLGSSQRAFSTDDVKSDKILEIDTEKLLYTSKHRNLFQTSSLSLSSDHCSHSFSTSKDSTAHQTVPSSFYCEVQSFSPSKFTQNGEESSFRSAENSPQSYVASSKGGSSRRGPFTSGRSDGLSGCCDRPNYMTYTESAKAKMRSLSTPKQRPQFERSSSTNRYSIHGHNDSWCGTQRISSLQSNFSSKAYPGPGCLDGP